MAARGDSPAPAVPDTAVTVDRPRVWVALAAALAFGLGLIQLGTDSFWVDDGFTLTHTSLGNADFWRVITDHEMNAALYSVLMHGWVQVGQS